MRTRKGTRYGSSPTAQGCRWWCDSKRGRETSVVVAVGGEGKRWRDSKRGREDVVGGVGGERKRRAGVNPFDGLPDDLLVSILAKLGSTATRPKDFINAFLTCKRFNKVGMQQAVLLEASTFVFAMKASRWCEGSQRFLKKCADAGNVEACYTLGMIRFYCLQNTGGGASLMAKAAIASHAPALYSLAVIQFNGSGGSKKDKDLKAGVALCARAAFLGHVDALRELGHCLQDGYGIAKNVTEGRRFLVQANARELASVYPAQSLKPQPHPHSLLNLHSSTSTSLEPWLKNLRRTTTANPVQTFSSLQGCPLLSDFGCNVPPPESHPAVKFLVEWFQLHPPGPGLRLCSYAGCGRPGPGLRLCSYAGCGRPETRKHEFRRCSVCGTVNYCSRACQALDWKIGHKTACMPVDDWLDDDDDEEEDDYEDDLIDEEFV